MRIVLLVYIIITIIISVFLRRKENFDSFHGENLGILMCVAIGTGEWLGGNSTIGVAEYGYEYGFSGSWYTLANAIGIIFLSLFLSEFYRKLNVSTVPEIFEIVIGEKTASISNFILLLISIIVGASQLIAIASMGEIFNINYFVTTIVFGIFITALTIISGINGIGNMNIVHIFVMYVGVILSIIYLLIKNGTTELSNLPREYFVINNIGNSKIISWVVASVFGACTAQAGIQPILTAKDHKTARKSAVLIALIIAPFGVASSFMGILSKVFCGELHNAKLAIPLLINRMNPIIGGILLSAIIASIISTITPIMLSFSTLFMKNIYNEKFDKKTSLKISKCLIFIFGVVCICLALFMYTKTKILDLVYTAYSIRCSLLVVLVLGIKWGKISDIGAFCGIFISSIVCIFWKLYYYNHGYYPIFAKVNETIITIITALIVTVIFSLMLNKKGLKNHGDFTN